VENLQQGRAQAEEDEDNDVRSVLENHHLGSLKGDIRWLEG